MNQVLTVHWLRWWARPWQWADPSWSTVIAEQGLSNAQFARLSAFYPDCLGAVFGIQACDPTFPDELVAGLLQGHDHREAALAMVDHLCSARASRSLPDEVSWRWCRSVAKALRPGSWLLDDTIDPLGLLAHWCGPAQWQRLRLLWPRNVAMAVTPVSCIDPKRLDMLWRVALHRVVEEDPHVRSSLA